MKEVVAPILFQIIGVLVIIAEIILPSGGILTILALGIFGYSLYLVFDTFSTTVSMLFILFDIITIPGLLFLGIKILAKSPVTLNKQLSKKEGVVSQSAELEKYLGRTGHAITSLRPAGKAIIDGSRLDVVSRGEFIEKDSSIVVADVTGNQIIVRNDSEKNGAR